MNKRLEIATRILAGFAANPAVFAPNPMSGWRLVNVTEKDLCAYAVHLAEYLVSEEEGQQGED